MNDAITIFQKLIMPLKQLGFTSDQVLYPVVQALTSHTKLTAESKLMLSAILASGIQVEEDFDG